MAEVPNINRAVVGLINKLIILKLIVFLNFLTLDLITFFITFELTLIPLFLMITQYGSKYKYFLPRLEAAYRLFFYSLFGSIFMLMSIILFFILYQTTDYELLNYYITTDKHNHSLLLISWIFLFFAFLVKIPTFPMFSWLPYAHSDAPTPGSIILAGIILKLGTYGIIRYSLLMYKPLNLQGIYIYYKPLIFLFGYISIIYCSLIALRALFDLKKIIAFSSIVHMNFSLFGLFSDNIIGIFGGTFLIFTHAFISCALFLLIGIIYKRFHTRNIIYLKGLFNFMPLFSFFLLLFSFANLSLPFASSFISELFILISTFTFNPFITLLLLFSLIFSTGFALWFPLRILFGQVSKYLINPITHTVGGYNNKPKVLSCDLTKIEFYSLLLLLILFFFLSVEVI